MEILSRIGVVVPHEDMLRRLAAAGAEVDEKSRRVRMGEEMVMKAVAAAGKSFTLYGRDTAKTAVFGAGRRNYNCVAGEASGGRALRRRPAAY